jgi:hypothetical protein
LGYQEWFGESAVLGHTAAPSGAAAAAAAATAVALQTQAEELPSTESGVSAGGGSSAVDRTAAAGEEEAALSVFASPLSVVSVTNVLLLLLTKQDVYAAVDYSTRRTLRANAARCAGALRLWVRLLGKGARVGASWLAASCFFVFFPRPYHTHACARPCPLLTTYAFRSHSLPPYPLAPSAANRARRAMSLTARPSWRGWPGRI